MAQVFTSREYNRFKRELQRDPAFYGLPQKVDGSVVLASFNIREFGSVKQAGTGRDAATMRFLAFICRHFDLVAIQEVLRDESGVTALKELMGSEYKLVLSDTTGSLPGKGDAERLAFIYREPMVRRTEMVTDVTFDRTDVLKRLALHLDDVKQAMEETNYVKTLLPPYRKALAAHEKAFQKYEKDLAKWKKSGSTGRPPKPPKEPKPPSIKTFKPKMPAFLSFIRTPYAVSFRVQGPSAKHYDFLAVNAHLHFGGKDPRDRQLENEAMIEWILAKVQRADTNIVQFGDLNFDYDDPDDDLERIVGKFRRLGGLRKDKKKLVHVSYPFLFRHPRTKQFMPPLPESIRNDPEELKREIFRSNVRLDQIYDQIGVFSRDKRLGGRMATRPEGHSPEEAWGKAPEGPDYGVVNITELFCRVLNRKSFFELKSAERSKFVKRYDFSVSDHMPIWLRVPLPGS